MKNRFLAFAVGVIMLAGCFENFSYAAESGGDIVILFESDVHCAVDGYTKIAALRNEEQQKGNFTALVSCGDFIQGGTLGAFSKGQYIIDIMNSVGYDVVTIGNHEFDYTIPVLEGLTEQLTAQVVSCSYVSLPDKEPVYAPYTILSFGDTDIAFVGITTPESFTKSTPKYFMNDSGEYIYDFCGENLYETVQNSVDRAEAEGADYVVALSHLGSEYVTERWSAQEVIKNTTGIDVILDGHSHSIIESSTLPNKDNENVLISSVGTKFEKIGRLSIDPDGNITAELIDTESYTGSDEAVDRTVSYINEQYSIEGNKPIGSSEVKLSVNDEDGNWIIRHQEANIGNFCADAYRTVLDADIGLMNGGGIRADIEEGDVTFSDILAVLPWENKICTAEASGQMILDMLEFSVKNYPETSGSFQQVSGIRFSFDPDIPSPVKLDEKEVYAGIEGSRRVWKAEILNRETGEYEAVDPDKMYTVASTAYFLKESGGGNTIFDDAEIINDADMLDTSVLQEYIQNYLGGTIGEEYRETDNRINVASKSDSYEEEGLINPFSDITEDNPYYSGIMAVYESGLMNGVSETLFDPDGALTKGMLVTILYRIEGQPEAGQTVFSDISEGAYYSDGAVWAYENGIISDISDGLFVPDDILTGEQLGIIISSFAEYSDETAGITEAYENYTSSNNDAQVYVTRAEAAEIFSKMI